MIPRRARFANPHLVPQQELKVNRNDLFEKDEEQEDVNSQDLEVLNNLIECGLLVPQTITPVKSKKRRREQVEEEEMHLFRLVSSSIQPISLLPPPPPEPITREPDAEDTEEQAEIRRVRAQSAAVTVDDIQFSASIEKSRPFSKQSYSAKASGPLPSVPLAVLCTAQQPRKTRPPVPIELLEQYPYAGQPSDLPPDSKLKVPQVNIEPSNKKPRRRNRSTTKERPPAQFWRPDPSWGGKCLGYSYGYPSGLAVMQGFGREDNWSGHNRNNHSCFYTPTMESTPPPNTPFNIPPMPHMHSPSTSRQRGSLGSSFSFGPQNLVDSFMDANSSTLSHMNSFALDPNRSVLPSSPLRSSPRKHKRGKSSTGRPHPLATDTTDVFQDSDDDADDESIEYEWGTIDRMRLWRHDALMQHLYETAAFWGDKILSWTNDPNDAFWLAQTYFMTQQYSRAERLLTRPFPMNSPKNIPGPAPPIPQNGHNVIHFPAMKGKGRDHDVSQLMLSQPRLPMGPGGMIDIPVEMQDRVSRLVDMSVACRYLAALCQVRQGNWVDATEMLGEANPFRESGASGPAIPNVDGGIKVEASMCNLRGILMLKLNRGEQAKQCFMEALALDVKCYDAFDQLITGEMMTPDEEWEFIQGLSYASQTPQDAQFVQLIYTSRLRKYKHAKEHALTRQRLVEEYGLGDNPDVLFSFADALYTNFRWADCYQITSRILGLVHVHNQTMPLHIACMYHLSHLHSKLFMLAHELVEREPENALSWYAVGVWYLSGKKWAQARQYFSKTSLMDPRFGPSWIAFGHTFALEGEHDHAVTAYSTCVRMFTGSHLPLMFVGMEHITLSNYMLADEALDAANIMCNGDPLLINERGVMAYNHGRYAEAAKLFQSALDLATATQSSQNAWVTTWVNLGTCFRKLKRLDEARKAYEKVLELDARHAVAIGFMGMVYHLMGDLDNAIIKYHEALSIDPINPHILELLNLALETQATSMDRFTNIQEKAGKYVRPSGNKGKEKAIIAAPIAGDQSSRIDAMSIG